jgi:hypothetical protein
MTILNTLSHMLSTFRVNEKAILLILWLGIQSSIAWHFGVVCSSDSPMYIEDAVSISNGIFPHGRSIVYMSYSSFIALVFLCNGTIETVVLIQILISGIATLCLYQFVFELSKNKKIAFIAVLLFLCWIKIHQWNTYIYTESLFTSFSIISIALLSMSKKGWHYVLTALVLVFTFFIRPTGFNVLFGLLAYLSVALLQKKILSTYIIVGIVISLITLVLIGLNYALQDYVYSFIASYKKAEVIYPSIHLWISIPQDIVTPADSYPPLLQLILFIGSNPLYFFKLFFLKMILFLANVKPYYSTLHNLIIVLVLYPCYAFAVYGFKAINNLKIKMYILTFITFQTITIAMTSENWDGRFLIPILPLIFICAAFGIYAAWKKYSTSLLH